MVTHGYKFLDRNMFAGPLQLGNRVPTWQTKKIDLIPSLIGARNMKKKINLLQDRSGEYWFTFCQVYRSFHQLLGLLVRLGRLHRSPLNDFQIGSSGLKVLERLSTDSSRNWHGLQTDLELDLPGSCYPEVLYGGKSMI